MKARAILSVLTLVWLVVPGLAAAADETVYDTSAATITCTSLVGTVMPKPLLGLAPQETVLTIKGTFSGCMVSGASPADPPLKVLSGKMKAKLPVTDANCITLVLEGFPVAGDFVFKWKTAKGQALDFPETIFTPEPPGLVADLMSIGMTQYGVFYATGALAAQSAFAGTTPQMMLMSAEDITNMAGQCCTDPSFCVPVGPGIKKLHFSIGQIQM